MTGGQKTIGEKALQIASTALVYAGCVVLGLAGVAAHATDTSVHTSQSSETVNLVVGHSAVMNTQVALRRIYVGNPQVLLSYTSSSNEIVVTGKSMGTSSLMVWDVNGGSKLYTIQVGADGTAVEEALKVEYPKEDIKATVSGDHISLSGNVSTKAVADGAADLARNYSKGVVSSLRVTGHPKEVQLKVRFIEVDRTKVAQFGVDILSLGLNGTLGQSGTQQFSSASIATIQSGGSGSQVTATIGNPLDYFVYSLKHNIGLSVEDLAAQNVLQILAEPTLSAMSGQSASFLSGGEFPFPTVQASAGSTPVVTVSFRPYGIKLDFTPTVNDDNTIRLKVAPEVSSLDYTNAVTISGYEIPALSTRRSQTEVELTPGQSFAISGLLDHQTTEAFDRTPGIASIPILGQLFKSKNNSHSVTELVVIITAELVDPMSPDAPRPVEPKMSVPNLDPQRFDKQLNKNHGADPNENRDTGKAVTPVAPQNAPSAVAPASVAGVPATAVPSAAVPSVAPPVSQASQANQGVSQPPAPMVEPVSSAVSSSALAPAPTPTSGSQATPGQVAAGQVTPGQDGAGATADNATAANHAPEAAGSYSGQVSNAGQVQMAMQPPGATTAGPAAASSSVTAQPDSNVPDAPKMHLRMKTVTDSNN